MPSTFLFVNKDAGSTSLTRSTAREQSSINSHVQRGRRHVRSGNNAARAAFRARTRVARDSSRTDDEPGLDDTTITGHEPASSSSAPPEAQPLDVDKNAKPRRRKSTPTKLPSRSRSRSSEVTSDLISTKATKESARPRLSHDRDGAVPSPMSSSQSSFSPQDITQVTPNYLDPFAQSVVKLDSHVATLCHYFAETYHPSVWNAERWGSSDGTYTHLPSAKIIVQRAMQSEVEMNAMLACMAARRENVDGLPDQGTNRYMGNALMAVRKRFGTASRDQLLLIIFHLYAGEAYRQNYQAAKIHMKAAESLFASWGGLNNIPDPAVRELFILGDLHMSAVLLEPCQLPCVYDPGPYWESTPTELQLAPEQDLDYIALAFRGAPVDQFMPKELSRIIDEMCECAWVLQHGTVEPSQASKHAVRWLQWRSAAIRYRLLALSFPDAGLEAVRVGLLLWVLITTVLLGLRMLGPRIAPKLQSLLRTARNPHHPWKTRVEIQIWVTTMGAMCAVPDSEVEKWFIHRLYDFGLTENIRLFREMHGPSTTTVDVLKNFQEKFFYYDKIQRPRLERLAKLLGVDTSAAAAARSSVSDPVNSGGSEGGDDRDWIPQSFGIPTLSSDGDHS